MKNNKRLAYIIILLCTIWVSYSIIKSYKKDIQLNSNGIQTVGRVIKFKRKTKSKGFIYVYYINGKPIKSESLIGLDENIRLGDFYRVIYLNKDPHTKNIYLDKKIIDTALILKAGFTKEEIKTKFY